MELVGVGIDLVDIARVERMMARLGERVLRRFLTARERAYVEARARPSMHLAARIAAKEAAYKALQALPGARSVSWHDLEVERETEGRPYLTLAGLAKELPTNTTCTSSSHSPIPTPPPALLRSSRGLVDPKCRSHGLTTEPQSSRSQHGNNKERNSFCCSVLAPCPS